MLKAFKNRQLIIVPLEGLTERYSVMMNSVLKPCADIWVYPDSFPEEGQITNGEFLDISRTIEFKTLQLNMIARMFSNNIIRDGDVFFFSDIFFPGLESVRYMAELAGIKIFVFAINYAGRSDPSDFVRKLNHWSDYSEKAWHEACDEVFVGSVWHEKKILEHFHIDNLFVTGLVYDPQWIKNICSIGLGKNDYVIWPHRPCLEKGLSELIKYAQITDRQIIMTSCGNRKLQLPAGKNLPSNVAVVYGLSKYEYYVLMAGARYYLSTAYQETFGYTLQEAILYSCIVAVPDRVCYPEFVKRESLYTDLHEIDRIFDNGILNKPVDYHNWQQMINRMTFIIEKGSKCIA